MKLAPLFPSLLCLFLMACGGGEKPGPGKKCSVNSDCNNPLSCTFGSCHAACADARDCPTGQTCVKGPAGKVCQLPAESHCEYRSQCPVPLTCALDRQCRSECQTDVDCPTKTQKCVLPDKICAEPADIDPTTNKLKNAQATPVPDAPDGGTADALGSGVAGSGGSGGGADGGVAGSGGTVDANMAGADVPPVNSCPSPQTTFGNIAQGDSNPRFTSGVGVRSGNTLYIFTGYSAPADAEGGVPGNFVWVQSFDAISGKSNGPAAPLFQAADGLTFSVDDVAVAPTGEIILLHSHASPGDARHNALFASFLATGAPDAGAAGLGVVHTGSIENALLGQPHAIWSVASSAFVVSWKYYTQNWYVRARKFLPDGRGAGGDTNIVANPAMSNNDTAWDEGRIGTSGNFFASLNRHPGNALPYLTILNREGAQVGDFVQISNSGISHWAIVGGLPTGFVGMFLSGNSAIGVYVPIDSDGKPQAPRPDGGVDGGPPTFASWSFPTTATTAQAISDDTGGNGGIGTVLLEQNGASFLYIKPDGASRLSTGTVISSSTGTQASISNYHGSFTISIFEMGTHAAQAVASGCAP